MKVIYLLPKNLKHIPGQKSISLYHQMKYTLEIPALLSCRYPASFIYCVRGTLLSYGRAVIAVSGNHLYKITHYQSQIFYRRWWLLSEMPSLFMRQLCLRKYYRLTIERHRTAKKNKTPSHRMPESADDMITAWANSRDRRSHVF